MGRLLERLKVKCRRCGHNHIPRRLSARFLDGERERMRLLVCKECGHIWQDSSLKSDKGRV
jgi:uncharacterized Zn finger protein